MSTYFDVFQGIFSIQKPIETTIARCYTVVIISDWEV
jgi:hypothetical protein